MVGLVFINQSASQSCFQLSRTASFWYVTQRCWRDNEDITWVRVDTNFTIEYWWQFLDSSLKRSIWCHAKTIPCEYPSWRNGARHWLYGKVYEELHELTFRSNKFAIFFPNKAFFAQKFCLLLCLTILFVAHTAKPSWIAVYVSSAANGKAREQNTGQQGAIWTGWTVFRLQKCFHRLMTRLLSLHLYETCPNSG